MHQRLEQQQRDQRRFDPAEAARGGIALGERRIDRSKSHQPVEDQAQHPPAVRRIELQPMTDLARRHHRRQPGRHGVAPVPDHPEQAERDQRRIEDDGGADDRAAGAGDVEGTGGVTAEQRQHDHPVQRHQQATRRLIVDRCDAALGCGGPEPGPKQQVERAPVEDGLQDFLAEPAGNALRIADLCQNETASHGQCDQGGQVEQESPPEGAQRRMADQAVETFQAGAVEQQADGIFRRQPRHHDAQQEERGAAVDDVGQVRQVPAQRGDLLHRELQPLDQEFQEGIGAALGAVGCLRRGRAGPRRGENAQRRCNAVP
jgi:hypothetical protein